MPELVGFQTMLIIDPYGMTFDAVGVFGLAFHLLFKSCSSYYVKSFFSIENHWNLSIFIRLGDQLLFMKLFESKLFILSKNVPNFLIIFGSLAMT